MITMQSSLFGLLTLLLLPRLHLVAGQECSVVDEVQFVNTTIVEYTPLGEYPRDYFTFVRGVQATEDCSDFRVDMGYQARKCNGACETFEPTDPNIGALVAQAISQTEFGREIIAGRVDLLDIGFLDSEGNRVDHLPLDTTVFDVLECYCEGDLVSDHKGSCPSPLACSTMGKTEYGSVSASFGSFLVGKVGSLQVNVSIVHETLEGEPFIVVGVPPRFETSEEGDGSFVMTKGPVRMIFDQKCGDNALSLASIGPEDPPRLIFFEDSLIPEHNRVLFTTDGTNLTCDWSYTIEIELEETSVAVRAAMSWLLTGFVAALHL